MLYFDVTSCYANESAALSRDSDVDINIDLDSRNRIEKCGVIVIPVVFHSICLASGDIETRDVQRVHVCVCVHA